MRALLSILLSASLCFLPCLSLAQQDLGPEEALPILVEDFLPYQDTVLYLNNGSLFQYDMQSKTSTLLLSGSFHHIFGDTNSVYLQNRDSYAIYRFDMESKSTIFHLSYADAVGDSPRAKLYYTGEDFILLTGSQNYQSKSFGVHWFQANKNIVLEGYLPEIASAAWDNSLLFNYKGSLVQLTQEDAEPKILSEIRPFSNIRNLQFDFANQLLYGFQGDILCKINPDLSQEEVAHSTLAYHYYPGNQFAKPLDYKQFVVLLPGQEPHYQTLDLSGVDYSKLLRLNVSSPFFLYEYFLEHPLAPIHLASKETEQSQSTPEAILPTLQEDSYDIFILQDLDAIESYIASDSLLDFSKVPALDSLIHRYYPYLQQSMQQSNGIFFLPYSIAPYYGRVDINNAFLEDSNITEESLPQTMEQLIAFLQKIDTTENAQKYDLLESSLLNYRGTLLLKAIIDEYAEQKYQNTEIDFSKAAFIEKMDAILSLQLEYFTDNPLLQGTASKAILLYQNKDDLFADPSPYTSPILSEGRPIYKLSGIVVNRNSKKLDLIVEFLQSYFDSLIPSKKFKLFQDMELDTFAKSESIYYTPDPSTKVVKVYNNELERYLAYSETSGEAVALRKDLTGEQNLEFLFKLGDLVYGRMEKDDFIAFLNEYLN